MLYVSLGGLDYLLENLIKKIKNIQKKGFKKMQRMDEGLAFLLQYENVAW